MKKKVCSALALLICACMLFLSSCSGADNGNAFLLHYGSEGDLAVGSSYTDVNDEALNAFSLTYNDSKRNYITVDLGDSKRFNTITLTENGNCIKQFAIYASNAADRGYTFIYQGDTIGSGRVCYTGDMQYRYIRVFVTDFEGEYDINGFSVYYNKNENAQDLRVTAYLRMDRVTEDTDFSGLAACTDLILFGCAKFTAAGNIIFVDGNGEEIEESEYARLVQIVRDAVGDRDIRLVADIAMPYGNDGKDIVSMMQDQMANTTDSIRAFIYKYDFDGYDIDYEYPYTEEEWAMYNNFLLAVREAIPDKILSVAASSWNLFYTEEVIAALDRIELMTYDLVDNFGYHASFANMAQNVLTAMEAGFSPEQIDFGLPFYSRPIDGYAFWGSYADYAQQMGRYNNLVYDNTFDHDGNPLATPQYFNSVQMVADKTAFALDVGIGGMMIWHFTDDVPYDNELSLFHTIQTVKQEKATANG